MPTHVIIEFELEGRTYAVRHYENWEVGRPVEMAVNPESPYDAVVADGPSIVPEIAFSVAVVLGLIALFYFVSFVIARRRERRG